MVIDDIKREAGELVLKRIKAYANLNVKYLFKNFEKVIVLPVRNSFELYLYENYFAPIIGYLYFFLVKGIKKEYIEEGIKALIPLREKIEKIYQIIDKNEWKRIRKIARRILKESQYNNRDLQMKKAKEYFKRDRIYFVLNIIEGEESLFFWELFLMMSIAKDMIKKGKIDNEKAKELNNDMNEIIKVLSEIKSYLEEKIQDFRERKMMSYKYRVKNFYNTLKLLQK
jgi:hypothetical protein